MFNIKIIEFKVIITLHCVWFLLVEISGMKMTYKMKMKMKMKGLSLAFGA